MAIASPGYSPAKTQGLGRNSKEQALIMDQAASAGARREAHIGLQPQASNPYQCLHPHKVGVLTFSGCRLCDFYLPTQLPRKFTLM